MRSPLAIVESNDDVLWSPHEFVWNGVLHSYCMHTHTHTHTHTEPVEIIPPIENMDISTRVIGEQASIGCSVATCAEEVTVNLMKGSVLIEQGLLTGTASQKVYNFVLTVDENTPGTYACKADIAGSTDMQEFNITGTTVMDYIPFGCDLAPLAGEAC